MSQLDLFGDLFEIEKPVPKVKTIPKQPIREPSGFTGDIITKISDRIRERKHSCPEPELREWIESSWHHDKFVNDNTGLDIAMLLLLDTSTEDIMKLFNN